MPEIPDSLLPREHGGKVTDGIIAWKTVTYRSVALFISAVALVIFGALLLLNPSLRGALVAWATGKGRDAAAALDSMTTHEARFTNLDGGVRIRKASGVEWMPADLSMRVEKGDLVQTTSNGVARIAFADGTLYVVQPNTLIAIEENTIPANRADAHVAVQVSSGVVDLSTSEQVGQSRVLFANAEARLRNESRALVRNDPKTNTREITVSQGGARVLRGSEQMELGQYEQVSFTTPESPMVKRKIVAPPTLLAPANMAPIVNTGPGGAEVEFSWSPVPTADSYRIRVSTSPLFSKLLYDRELHSTSVRLPAFTEGDYYWSVTSINSQTKESKESDTNQFSVVKQEGGDELPLVVDKYVQHGRVIEVIGRTEPGATVLVNNEPVFAVAPDGSFKHFTSPLPTSGPNRITVTAQNSQGKIATVRTTVTIQ